MDILMLIFIENDILLYFQIYWYTKLKKVLLSDLSTKKYIKNLE